jgi:hypothetical protein
LSMEEQETLVDIVSRDVWPNAAVSNWLARSRRRDRSLRLAAAVRPPRMR